MPFREYTPEELALGELTIPGEAVPARSAQPQAEGEAAPTTTETLAAAARQENTIGNLISLTGEAPLENRVIDDEHDPFEGVQGTKYEPYAGSLVGSINEEDTRRRKARIDRELQDRDVLNRSGLTGTAAAFAAGILDVPSLFPGGTIVRGVRGGIAIGRTAGGAAAAGGASAAAGEVLLQAGQETRPLSESAINIGGAVLLSGLLGAGIGSLAKRTQTRLANDLETQAVAPDDPNLDKFTPGHLDEADVAKANGTGAAQATSVGSGADSSAGAARARTGDTELEGAFGVEKAVGIQDPMIRTQRSSNPATRNVVEDLAETPLATKKARKGEAQARGGSVETNAKMWQAAVARSIEALDEQFMLHHFGRKVVAGRARAAFSRAPGKLAYNDFKKAVSHAMRNNDTHADPQVQEAARVMRREVFDPLKERAIELGLLPEGVDVETADSYLSRLYDRQQIVPRRKEFQERIMQHLRSERDQAGVLFDQNELELSDVGANLKSLRSEIAKGIRERTGLDLRKKIEKQRGREQEARRGLRTQETDLRRAEAERTELQDELTEQEIEDISQRTFDRGLLRDMKRKKLPVTTLSDDLAEIGGIKDTGGDIRAMLGHKRRSKLIDNENGMQADIAVRHLHDLGYFPDRDFDELTPDDLFDAIGREIAGERVVSQNHQERLEYVQTVEELRDKLEADGFDINRAKTDDLTRELTGERFLGKKYERLRGRLVQARRHSRQRLNRVLTGDERVGDVQSTLADLEEAYKALRGRSPEISARLKELRKSVAADVGRRRKVQREQRKLGVRMSRDDLELTALADEIIDRIIGTPDGRLPYDAHLDKGSGGGQRVQGLAPPLRARVFNIPDALIEDFLENDIEVLARIYTKSMATDVEMVRKFGSVDMTAQMKEIVEEANNRINQATTEKERIRAQKQKDADVRDIAAMRDRIRGTYALPEDPDSMLIRTGRVVRSLNYVRLLGGMTISAIPDAARVVMVHGMSRTLGDGLRPLLTNFRAFRAAAEEIKLAGTALDMILDTRTMQIADIMDDYGRHSKFERAVQGAAGKFGLVSLMAPWNATMKQFSGMVVMTRILRAAEQVATKGGTVDVGVRTDGVLKTARVATGGKISPSDVRALAQLGLDEPLLKKIWQQFDTKGGQISDGVYLPNTVGWDDREAVEALRGALVRDVDKVVVTPGQDRPLLMSDDLGKLLFQFKSFPVAAAQRVLLAGLQQRDAAALNGMMLSMMLGGLVYMIKEHARGRGDQITDDPRVFLTEAFDHSGLAGWFMEANNLAAKWTGGTVSLSGQPLSRYNSRNWLGAFLGPTVGLGEDARRLVYDISTGAFNETSVRALRRLLPMQNVFYARSMLNELEKSLNNAFGVPESGR